ncbi:hypothetical protein MFLAVUS_001973 [Mucor flavus]|uniref:Uncharacterized protein n=1 Tax=Mucor flavus TaxID=439312 RepID=A0ABP9YP22_9FUNG
MISSKILFLLCLAIICHVIVRAAVIKSIGNVINASASYTAYPTSISIWNSDSTNHEENQYSLPLHLTKSAVVQVYNYGPYGSKVDIYDHHQKIGESGSYNLTTLSYNNIGRVYLSKGDHSLSLQPYYKNGKTEDSLSTHFVKVHVLPKSRAHFLKKRDPVYNNADEYTPEYNAYIQWDYDGSSKHYHNGGDDSVPKHYHNDGDEDEDNEDEDDEDDKDDEDEDNCDEDEDDNDDEPDKSYHKDTSMDKHWWKWHKKGGWMMGKKKVIYISTVHYSEPTTPAPITVTSTLIVDHISTIHHTSTIPEPPTPSPLERMVTETVIRTGPTETVQRPGITETVNKAGPTETTTVTVKGATAEATVILPILINTVTEYRDHPSTPSDNHSVETIRIVTVTAEGGVTTIPGSPITISNNPVTVSMEGQMTTVFPEPITLINEPVTVTNEPITITSTVDVDVTHYLFRQTVLQTVFQTDTTLVTVAFTSHNEVLQTVIGTSTTTENIVITVISTRSRTTATRTPTPSLTPP